LKLLSSFSILLSVFPIFKSVFYAICTIPGSFFPVLKVVSVLAISLENSFIMYILVFRNKKQLNKERLLLW